MTVPNFVKKATRSRPAQGVPFYTPAQDPPAGTALGVRGNKAAKVGEGDSAEVPTLFTPLRIRGVELNNRFMVSPLCMYSADDGHLTDFQLVHLGRFALGGAALICVEATSVTPNGRISPEDAGLWTDSQIAPLRRVADFIHSQGLKVAIQLGHAGRKASTLGPWHKPYGVANAEDGGWPDDVWAPSAISFDDGTCPHPKAMTIEQIDSLKQSFADAARRAVEAGVDVIEIHSAHGYLLTEFMSPLSNKRTDQYGGSFENRTRLTREVIETVRGQIPEAMPLFVRISATEWMEQAVSEPEGSWDLEQSIRFAKQLPALGVDLLDVSSGGNTAAQKIQVHPYYQVDLAGKIREAIRAQGDDMLIGAVGLITEAEMARSIVQQGRLVNGGGAKPNTIEVESEQGQKTQADLVLVGRQFLRDPNFVIHVAQDLGVEVKTANQFHRA